MSITSFIKKRPVEDESPSNPKRACPETESGSKSTPISTPEKPPRINPSTTSTPVTPRPTNIHSASAATPRSTNIHSTPSVTPKSSKIPNKVLDSASSMCVYFNPEKQTNHDGQRNEDEWPHLKYDFLMPNKIRDIERRRPDHPDYDARTLYVPQSFLDEQTPALRQWWKIKQQNMDSILFFKMGKFYEFFNMDAVVGVNELDIMYMKSEDDKPAHAGFPEVSYAKFANILVQKGYKVLRIEQTETPSMMEERCQRLGQKSKFDKVVAREICRVTTKGTQMMGITESAFHTHHNQYLLAITETQSLDKSTDAIVGVCFVDVTIGKIHVGQFADDRHRSNLHMLVAHHTPVEILIERNALSQLTLDVLRQTGASIVTLKNEQEFWNSRRCMAYLRDKELYTNAKGEFYWPQFLADMFEDGDNAITLAGCMPKQEHELAVKCFGAIVYYLDSCMIAGNVLSAGLFESYTPPLDGLIGSLDSESADANRRRSLPNKMILDHVALRNLEVFQNSSGTKLGTLYDAVNMCKTPFGCRLLKDWMCTPLCEIDAINSRLDAVEDLLEPTNGSLYNALVSMLKETPDLERLLSRILGQSQRTDADARAILFDKDIYSKAKIKSFLEVLGHFKRILRTISGFEYHVTKLKSSSLKRLLSLKSNGGLFPEMESTLKFFDEAFDHRQAKEMGKIIPAPGVDDEYDVADSKIREIEHNLDEYLEKQRRILNCQVNYFGSGKNRYQLELPEGACKYLTPEYQIETTRKGFKRYYTPFIKTEFEKLERAEALKDKALECILAKIFGKFCKHYQMWTNAVECLANLDVIQSFVQFSRSMKACNVDLCRPEFISLSDDDIDQSKSRPILEYKEGRHPALVKLSPNFTPNDLVLDERLILLTGANMGGKSTLMRQTGLMVILAQMGCLVPAQTFRLSPVDRIFSRLGATDRILEGESTFYTELVETSTMLYHASKHSLVLLDELGRGTATYDGTAIAYAVITEICDRIKCRCLFSTHYHSLIDDFHEHPMVRQAHMACKVEDPTSGDPTEENITFLYKLSEGSCPKSYGFNVARLAGLSSSIIKEAQAKSREFELNFVILNMFQQMRSGIENIVDTATEDTLLQDIVMETAGIIYPPPDLRVVVDKTAGFIAKNGPEFESRVRQDQRDNPKFNFLRPNDPYHTYFLHKLRELKEKQTQDVLQAQQAESAATNGQRQPTDEAAKPDQEEQSQGTYDDDNQDNQVGADEEIDGDKIDEKPFMLLEEEPEIPSEPPADYEFMAEPPPSLTSCNLEIIKLTAQFVAMHGREFLTNLLDREQNNVQFDFLRPQHGNFEYFSLLIEQYSKILNFSEEAIEQLKAETKQKTVLDKVKIRAEWTRRENTERQRLKEEEEQAQLRYAQIDWHDFVVVETIDFAPNERGPYPPPTTPDQVGSRALIEQRLAEERNIPQDMDMELSSDEESGEHEFVAPSLANAAPPKLDEVLIKKDYDPKQKAKSALKPDAYFISPITNERVPADQLQHHVRYGLIDPSWIEQKDRQIQAKINQEDVLASGAQMESSLKHLAERRTDIFGSGDKETEIGRKIDEEADAESQMPNTIIWDGHTSTVGAVTRAAQALAGDAPVLKKSRTGE
ncbi:DNA mismatch repair protein Msh6, partial [Fragariocoptes setiger]